PLSPGIMYGRNVTVCAASGTAHIESSSETIGAAMRPCHGDFTKASFVAERKARAHRDWWCASSQEAVTLESTICEVPVKWQRLNRNGEKNFRAVGRMRSRRRCPDRILMRR